MTTPLFLVFSLQVDLCLEGQVEAKLYSTQSQAFQIILSDLALCHLKHALP